MKIKTVLFACMVASTTSVYAQDLYVVGSVGQSRYSGDGAGSSTFDNTFANNGASVQSSGVSNTDTAFKLLLGYQFNPYFAVEGGYVNLGQLSYNGNFADGTGNGTLKNDGAVIDALGIYPLSNGFSVFAKGGLYYSNTSLNLSSGAPSVGGAYTYSGSSNSTNLNYGVGLSYALTPAFSVRTEYERFNNVGDTTVTGGRSNVDLWSVGLVGKF